MYEDFKAFLTTKIKEEWEEKWGKEWKENEEKHRNELQQKDDIIQTLHRENAELRKRMKF